MINRFSQYLVEEEKVVYFTFGRMNPPTIGHGKLLDALASKAGRNPYRVYLSQSQSAKKDPIAFKDKVKHVRKMFPKHARQVVVNKKVITPFHALSDLYSQGYRKVVMVAGSDRVNEYEIRLNKYNGQKGAHGFYNFDGGIKIISAGERDPDAEGAEGASGTKQRGYASDNNFTKFAQGLPTAMSNSDARRLFNDVRKGMGLKEEKEFKRHIQLTSVSETREKFIEGKLFELGEQVIIKKTDEVGTISVLGSNYVIVETVDRKTRQWLDAVEKIEEKTDRWYKDQPEWGTPESTKKAKKKTPGETVKEGQSWRSEGHYTADGKEWKGDQHAHNGVVMTGKTHTKDSQKLYHYKELSAEIRKKIESGLDEGSKGLWHNIRKRREKGLPKLKPGDKNYPKTLDIEERAMGQVKDIISQDKQDLAKDKEAMKLKHDRMMDRARRSRMLQRNKGIKS